MDGIVASPHWEWWLVFYFFLGGIAAGAYFMAALIELFGSDKDREVAKVAYYIAFPLIAICGILLILDLGRPERFWHLLVEAHTWQPMFKWWSPISIGSWAILLFSAFTFLSFVGVLAEDGRFGLGRFSKLARALHRGPPGLLFELAGAAVGFFVAAYTGVLLTASSQPWWRDSYLIGAMFLTSAASAGIAAMILLRWRSAPHRSIQKLEKADSYAIVLELLMIVAFLVSLGRLGLTFVGSSFGALVLVITVLLGLIVPLVLRFQPVFGPRSIVVSAILVLLGGFALRYAVLMAGQYLPQVAGG
jgi:formate-dependent nitrite reductase membrane component NrfD